MAIIGLLKKGIGTSRQAKSTGEIERSLRASLFFQHAARANSECRQDDESDSYRSDDGPGGDCPGLCCHCASGGQSSRSRRGWRRCRSRSARAPATTTTPNGTTVVAVSPAAPSCCPPPTLWQFLGVTNLLKHLGADLTQLRNCLGSIFPGLEATPALTAITDPSNLNSSNPAESAAAAAKADEDQAPQKIKAINYLATLGCVGCYAGVEDALLASLDDCTESVRFAAAKAFRDLSGKPCSVCKTKSCCSPKVRKRLEEVANKMVDGCYKESSARVRRMARLALAGCGGASAPKPGPKEGPSEAPTPAEGKGRAKTADAKDAADEPTLADEDDEDSAHGAAKTASNAALPDPDDPATQARVAQAVAQVQSVMRPAVNADCGCVVPQPVVTQFTIPNSPIQRASATSNTAPAAAGNSAGTPSKGPASNSASAATMPNSGTSADVAAPSSTDSLAMSLVRAIGFAVTAPKTGAASKPASASTPAAIKDAAVQTVGTELAEVNGQPVFENEVLPAVDRQLAALGPNVSMAEKMRQRPAVVRRELAHVIDRKLICQESHRSASGIIVASHTSGAEDEGAVADAWLQRVVRPDEHVEPAEIVAYYQANQLRFMQPGEVRYEEVSAAIGRFPSRVLALAAIRYVRDRVQGIPAKPPAVNMAAVEVRLFQLDAARASQLLRLVGHVVSIADRRAEPAVRHRRCNLFGARLGTPQCRACSVGRGSRDYPAAGCQQSPRLSGGGLCRRAARPRRSLDGVRSAVAEPGPFGPARRV